MKDDSTVANDQLHAPPIDLHSALRKLQLGFKRKLPFYRQTEAAECGLACLSMIATYHGHVTDIATMRRQFSLSLRGTTLIQLTEIATGLDLAPRPIRLDLEELNQLKTPAILHWGFEHFVVLKSVTRTGAIIHDPARGVRNCPQEEVSKNFTGVALELSPTSKFQRKIQTQKVNLTQMMGKVVGLKRSLIQITALALVLEVLSLITPFFNQWVVDQAIVTADLDLLLTLAVGFGIFCVINVLIESVRNWAVIIMSTNLNVQWLTNLLTHLMRLPINYFEKRHIGDVISRFNSIHSIQNTITNSFIGAILDGLMSIGTVIMMFIYSTQLSIIGIVTVLIYIFLRVMFYAALMSASESALALDAKQQTMFMETVRGIQSIRLFAKENSRVARWLNVVVDQKNASLRTQKLNLVFQSGNKLLLGLDNVVTLALGAKMVIGHTFSVGMLFAYISYKNQFSSRISSLVDKLFELKMLGLQTQRLADIALSEPENYNQSHIQETGVIKPSIDISNLWFHYGQGEQAVLRGISLKIEAGESVALIGPSGCGKTTLIKILLGILNETHGRVEIGGIELKKVGLKNYRKMIGTVMQEDVLFSGTIADNISFFDDKAEQRWVETCARMAAVHDDILAMPMGYSTLVGDMGTSLSGGQKQRLLLARALYRKPKILFLDEATSHLDVANESAVNNVIKNLALTRVIVAHRSETIAAADRVINLADLNAAGTQAAA